MKEEGQPDMRERLESAETVGIVPGRAERNMPARVGTETGLPGDPEFIRKTGMDSANRRRTQFSEPLVEKNISIRNVRDASGLKSSSRR